MVRSDKVAVVEQVRDELDRNPAILLTEYRGLTVAELADLRRQLREVGARYQVVKNTLARIAVKEAGLDGQLDDALTGPTALAFCGEDPVGPAKVLRRFARDHPELMVKAAILEGRFLDEASTQRLADLESREELLARFAGLMYSMMAAPARLLQAPIAQLARLMAALQEKQGTAGPANEGGGNDGQGDENAPAGDEADSTEGEAEAAGPDASQPQPNGSPDE